MNELLERYLGRQAELTKAAKRAFRLSATQSRTLIGAMYVGKFGLRDTYENRFKVGHFLVQYGEELELS